MNISAKEVCKQRGPRCSILKIKSLQSGCYREVSLTSFSEFFRSLLRSAKLQMVACQGAHFFQNILILKTFTVF